MGKLTLKQNTCAARIFLNTFGLILENVEEVDEFSKIKIFNQTMNEVGKLHFDNGKVFMAANYNNCLLRANFDIAETSGFIDKECGNASFGQWISKIAFQVEQQNNINLSGNFSINCSVDSEFGITCRCYSLINCEVSNKGKITLKFQKGYFEMKANREDYHETIVIIPNNEIRGFIRHNITQEDSNKNQYEKQAGIFFAGEGDTLHVFLSETKNQNEIAFRNEFPLKVTKDASKELVIQKGMLMKELDPDMFKTIENLKKLLFIGDISLLDNLISVHFENYTDKELNALFGINIQRMNYQDGADNLLNSYYGIGLNEEFFSLEKQQKLLKK